MTRLFVSITNIPRFRHLTNHNHTSSTFCMNSARDTFPLFAQSVIQLLKCPTGNDKPRARRLGNTMLLGTIRDQSLTRETVVVQNSARGRCHERRRWRGRKRREAARGSLPGDLEESGLRLPGNPREHYRIGTRTRVRVTRAHGGKQRRKGSYEFVSDFGYHVRRHLADISFGLPVCIRGARARARIHTHTHTYRYTRTSKGWHTSLAHEQETLQV